MVDIRSIECLLNKKHNRVVSEMPEQEEISRLSNEIDRERENVRRRKEDRKSGIIDLGDGDYIMYCPDKYIWSKRINEIMEQLSDAKDRLHRKEAKLDKKREELLDRAILEGITDDLKAEIEEVFDGKNGRQNNNNN